MGTPGSYYGWIFPPEIPFETVVQEVTTALENCGFHQGDNHLIHRKFATKEGRSKTFHLRPRKSGIHGNPDFHLVYEQPRNAVFRPVELDFRPECFESTLADYELAKQIFDSCSAIECFGFHASQDNAVGFEDSGLNFLFTRSGPQLPLAHLDERRRLLPEEIEPVFSFHDAYKEFLPWDRLLYSVFFTRFTPEFHDLPTESQFLIEYARTNRLIERNWKDYFSAGGTVGA